MQPNHFPSTSKDPIPSGGECLQVGLLPNPIVAYAGDEIGDEGKAGMQGMVVAQEIVTAGKLRWNRAVVKKEIDMAHQNLEMQRLRVQNDVIAAGYNRW